jgi:hypothetical protein
VGLADAFEIGRGLTTVQTVRISLQEYVQAVLRTFMLLSVAGEFPTTTVSSKKPNQSGWAFCFSGCRIFYGC